MPSFLPPEFGIKTLLISRLMWMLCWPGCRPGPEQESDAGPTAARLDEVAQSPLKKTLPLVFWNVENYFDDRDDPHGHDNDRVRWYDRELYELKSDSLVKILTPFARDGAILTFAELEHKAVLENLRRRLPGGNRYQIVYHHIRSARIKQGALSPFPVRRSNGIEYMRGQRPILEMELDVYGEPLVIFVNHWKSRRGGVEETEPKRMAAGRALYKRILKLRKKNPGLAIVAVGDFNDEPEDPSLRESLHSHADKDSVRQNPMYLWNCLQKKGRGTTSFRGRWQLLDQIIISPGLLDHKGIQVKSCFVYDAGGDLIRRNRPWRFGEFGTPHANRGYSDHLPVVLQLR